MSWTLICLIIQTVVGQSGAPVSLQSGAVLTIFGAGTLTIPPDPSSPYSPNDFYTSVEISADSVYILGSNRMIEIFGKSNLAIPKQTVNNYSYSMGGTLNLIYLSVNPSESLAAVTSFTSSTLKHLTYASDSSGLQSYRGEFGGQSFFMSPSKVITTDSLVFAYFRAPFGNDSISITDISSNASQTITLPFLSCSIAVTPDHQTALIWDSFTKVYIYSLNWTFSQKHIFNASITPNQYST